MLIDTTREYDLAELAKTAEDEAKPDSKRIQASRTMYRIKQLMNDPYIRSQRHRLVKATIANDIDAIWQISEQLQEYQYRKYPK